MKLTILSDADQRDLTVRAIVTAQCETDAMSADRLTVGTSGPEWEYLYSAGQRRAKACEWLALAA